MLTCWLVRRSKKTSKLCVTGLCDGNSPVTGEFPAQKASNAEDISLWCRHNDITYTIFPRGQWVEIRRKLDHQWIKWCIIAHSVPSHSCTTLIYCQLGHMKKLRSNLHEMQRNSIEEIVFKMSTAKSCRFSQTSLNQLNERLFGVSSRIVLNEFPFQTYFQSLWMLLLLRNVKNIDVLWFGWLNNSCRWFIARLQYLQCVSNSPISQIFFP